MKIDSTSVIGIVGAGIMGRGIAQVAARSGHQVILYDNWDGAVDNAMKINETELSKLVEKGKLSQEDKDKTISLMKPTMKIEDLAPCDLIIEAIPEKLELKKEIFSEIDKSASPNAIMTTNSSSIPISKLEDVVERKDKVMNLHFYNLFTMPMADIMRGTQTSEETFQKVKNWVESIEITPLEVKKECYGFVFNRIWRAIKKDCLKIWAGGYADIETVDKAWIIFCQYFIKNQYGPFGFMDRIGLDVIYDIEMSYFKNSSLDDDKPPETLKEMVNRGELGVKTGKGFYNY